MSTIVTPEMIKAGTVILGRADEASPEAVVEMIYRAMAAAAPRDSASQRMAEIENQVSVAAGLAQAQRERIQASDDLLKTLRNRVAELEETYLGIPPRPN